MVAPLRMRSGDVKVLSSSYSLINRQDQLNQAMDGLGSVIGIDTEFFHRITYFPVPALIQVSSSSEQFLIDPQTDIDFTSLKQILSDTKTTKIMHSPSADLEIFHNNFSVHARPVFDTQLAFAFLSCDLHVSYAEIVHSILGISLNKNETTSDWLVRPLSDSQMYYAIADVLHLIPLWKKLCARLEIEGRSSWFKEESRIRTSRQKPIDNQYFRKVRGQSRLSSRELAVLRSLMEWRDTEARRRDIPRTFVIRDECLRQLAVLKKCNPSVLKEYLSKKQIARYQQKVMDAHKRGMNDLHPPPVHEPVSRSILTKLQGVVKEISHSLKIATPLLATKFELERCIRIFKQEGELPKDWGSWRYELLADKLAEILKRGRQTQLFES